MASIIKPFTKMIPVLVFFIALSANGQDGPLIRGERPQPRERANPRRTPRRIIHEREFTENPALAARTHQTVVLDLEPATTAQALQENLVRFQLNGGAHRLCLDENDRYLTGLSLEDVSGQTLVKLDRSTGCANVMIPPGVHGMRITHDAGSITGAGRVAFVQAPSPSVPINGAGGAPVGGYWALQPAPSLDPQGRLGRMRAQPPFQNYSSDYPSIEPIVLDFSSQSIDDNALFLFNRGGYQPRLFAADPNPEFPYGLAVDITANPFPNLTNGWYLIAIGSQCDGDCNSLFALADNNLPQNFIFNDLGNSKVSWSFTTDILSFKLRFNLALENWIRLYPPGLDEVTAQLLFRFFPDGTPIDPPLREGEVALFQGCNYTGKATVFSLNTADFSALTSPIITLDKTAASIKLGNNTAVTLYSAANYQGDSQLIEADTPCLTGTTIGTGTRSIQLQPLLPLVVASSNCVNCKLEDVDLSGKDLSGINLEGADLSGAVLTKTVLHDAVSLVKTNFTGATLSCTDFSGTGTNQVDLTQTIFINAKFTQDFSCRADFSNTKLSTQVLSPSLWRYMDLTDAVIEGLTTAALSSASQQLNLSNAILSGMNFSGADLTAAIFSNSMLDGVNLSGAKLYGASLDDVNLEGANLSNAFLTNNRDANVGTAANLSGSWLKNVNLSNAQLSGATMNNVNFYGSVSVGQGTCAIDSQGFTQGCASAAGATMNNTQFPGAYLYGVDFTNATIQGVQFGGAVLIGANFAGAKLSTDPSVGTESGFTFAFLQGANLAPATLTGISLQGAFVDFNTNGNDMYLLLDATHTVFEGWQPSGEKVCVFAFYSKPTTAPENNTTLICPDGLAAGASGCGKTEAANLRWKSPADISQTNPPASYVEDATYTKKSATPICSPINTKW